MTARVLKFGLESFAGQIVCGPTYDRLYRLRDMASDVFGVYAGTVIEIVLKRYHWHAIPEDTGQMLDRMESDCLEALNESTHSRADFGGELF